MLDIEVSEEEARIISLKKLKAAYEAAAKDPCGVKFYHVRNCPPSGTVRDDDGRGHSAH